MSSPWASSQAKATCAGPAAYATRAPEKPTAQAVALAFLRGAVCTTTPPGGPSGCLTVQGAPASSDESRAVHDLLVDWRNDAGVRLGGASGAPSTRVIFRATPTLGVLPGSS
ncbi:hypothetical protein [Streptomyces scabichelini]|uniref:hypothetical protein n=1 Tax=Streptomyces scabichelini TaxID=2711217 RepID=UPI001F4A048D|nr:hypothetical protein [Streptomyces scabichelini]